MKQVVVNGKTFYAKMLYDKGGMNYFSSRPQPRGYYVVVQRQANQFQMISTLADEAGIAKMLIEETGRLNRKRLEQLDNEIEKHTRSLINISIAAGHSPFKEEA